MLFRQVHLDFHTSEKIEGVGSRFSKAQFQDALIRGQVNSVTLFSKCHHGWSYHPTKVNIMHPHLDFDLLGRQIEAAHEIGVKTPVYISAGFDEKYARTHPEWLARDRSEQTRWVKDFTTPGYHLLCFNTGYFEELLEQVREVCRSYDIDGLFLDIASPQVCYCRRCVSILESEGKDPYDKENAHELAYRTYKMYTKRIREAVDAIKPGLEIFHNGGKIPRGRRDLERLNSHIEIESLPTGGWGYDNLPLTARYVQSHNMPYLSMTGRFHLGWGEFGGYKHENALIYETSLAVANGAKCSVGDQLHPLGMMDDETYRLIGKAYAEIEKKEPWLDGVESVADIALFSYEAWLSYQGREAEKKDMNIDIGAVRILLEGHYLFDVVDAESDLRRYKLLILPDGIKMDAFLRGKIEEFLKNGGKLLSTGKSGLADPAEPAGKPVFAFDFGAEYVGERPITPAYLKPSADILDMGKASCVLYSPTEIVRLSGGREHAAAETPYFSRTAGHFCSHRHAPSNLGYDGVGMCEGRDGVYIAAGIFNEYGTVGSIFAKRLVQAAIDRCLGKGKTVEVNLPAQGIVTLMDQREKKRLVLHLLYAPRVCRGNMGIEVIEDALPLHDLHIRLRCDRKISKVYAAPSGRPLACRQDPDGWVVELPVFTIHGMVVLEYE